MCICVFMLCFHVHTSTNHRYLFLWQHAHQIYKQFSPQIMPGIIPTQLTCSSPSRMLRRNNRSSLERSSGWWLLPLCGFSDLGHGRISSNSMVGSLSCCLCFMFWKFWSLLCLGNCFWAKPSGSLLLERIL